MRHRVRIQPYVSPEVHRKLRAYAATRELTESGVAEAALAEYLDRDLVEPALVVRRLDTLTQAVGQVQRDLDVVAQALALLAKYTFLVAPSSTVPDATRRADAMYAQFVASIAQQLQAGVRLAGDVRRPRTAPGTPTATPAAQGGR